MADQLKGGPKLLSTIKSMKALLEEHFEGIVFHERKIENVFCKVYRIHGGDDYLWFDCLLSGQVLFSFDGDSVLVMTDDRRKRYLDGSAIISLWPWEDGLGTMRDIIPRCKHLLCDAALPDDLQLRQTELPFDLTGAKGRIELEFYNLLVPKIEHRCHGTTELLRKYNFIR